MPELPEVETIARFLREGGRNGPSILGRQVTSANLLWQRTLASPIGPVELQTRLTGRAAASVGRRGKFLLIGFPQDVLIFHLRMSGDLRVVRADLPIETHDRFSLDFMDGWRLVFNDTRKFGRLWLTEDAQDVLGDLGPEPFDAQLTPERFHARLTGRRRQLKPLLLDQTFLAGLGNIYSDEALFRARLHPLRSSDSLKPSESDCLLKAIRDTLEEAIKRQGSSIDWVYRGGDFQNYFNVYQRTGKACPRCGTPIERIVVGQRGTHFCPNCQSIDARG
jgi:formamidopyrimidine-DNA glycosylase